MTFSAKASPIPGKEMSCVFEAEFRSTKSRELLLLFAVDRFELFGSTALLARPQAASSSPALSSMMPRYFRRELREFLAAIFPQIQLATLSLCSHLAGACER